MGANASAPSKCCRPCIAQQGAATPREPRQETHGAWVRLQTDGKGPSPRSGHDVVVIDDKAYLFGGCGGEHEAINCLDDMYVFDMRLHRWDRVVGKGVVTPTARASFGMCAGTAPGTIIVAGGTGVEMDSLRGDVLEFDTRTRSWSKVLMDKEKTPCQFYGQSACRYGEVLLLFGGSTGLHYSNDLYEYNVRSGKWRKLATTGRKPSPRYKHQAVVVGDCMYVIGGGCFKPEQSTIDLYCLDLKTLVWAETTEMHGDIPKARVAHSCSYDPVGGDIYLWGGFTSELSRLQDFYAFNVASGTWRHIETDDRTCPPARAFHCAVFHEGSLYLFSGANGDVRYSDVWRYQVRTEVPSLAVLAARLLRDGAINPRKDTVLRLPQEVLFGVQHMNEYATRLC
ncbi:unnamed protein product [Phaeothamnion confervicola]